MASSRSELTVQFMLELAGALNDAGEPVALNQARMERIAAAYDITHARVAVLPNMVLAAGGRGAPTALELTHLRLSTNRLDTTAAVDTLAREAERGAIDPEDGLRRLDEIAAMRHRFGTAGVIGGHMVLTLGLALILQPTPDALAAAAVFGALIAGVSLEKALTNEAENTLGDWAPWLGVFVFGIGAFVHFSGPRRSLGWLLVVLLAAWIGQLVGGRLVSDTLGAFFGALIATPVAAWLATRPSGPPSLALVPARVLAARTRRGRPDRHGRVRGLQPRGRTRPLRQLPHHLHLDRDRRAGRQRARPAMDPTRPRNDESRAVARLSKGGGNRFDSPDIPGNRGICHNRPLKFPRIAAQRAVHVPLTAFTLPTLQSVAASDEVGEARKRTGKTGSWRVQRRNRAAPASGPSPP